MQEIQKAAVIGAGTMGAGIASHLTNAGVPVVLLDVVVPGEANRSLLAERAIERLLGSSPPAFMHPDNAALITPGNVDDHLHLVADVDWIAEAVVERIDVKRALYARIEGVRKADSFVTSNTSTLPLSLLTDGMSNAMRESFCITHFFNPVRYMRLLELVAGPDTRADVVETLTRFCDQELGKGVVPCRDTPGFLGNRVGVFALQVGLIEAAAHGLSVEEADAIMGRPMGIPKTGVFGLYDLIGLDLMLDVVKSLQMALPDGDAFHAVAAGIPAVSELVEAGHTGNKRGAGFYRSRRVGDEQLREVLDLATGSYRALERSTPEAAIVAETHGLRALAEHPSPGGRFAWRVLARTLSYAASLIPEVADTPLPVDEAMKLGYSWSRGPFEMIDALGPAWLAQRLAADGLHVPPVLAAAGERGFYRVREDHIEQLGAGGAYGAIRRAPGVVRLSDLKPTGHRLLGNDAASLWDLGDDVACIEFHTKANALSPASMEVVNEAVQRAAREHRALVLYNEAPHFSVGFDLGFALACARRRAWTELERALLEFQQACSACAYAPVPIVGAPSGLGLGGGFEVLLHCDALQVHANSTVGLVETQVGVVPSGGGCKQMLARWAPQPATPADALEGALRVFELIGTARTASSPREARPHRFLRDVDRVTMNRDRLLSEAKRYALELSADYRAPRPPRFVALGQAGTDAMEAVLDALAAKRVALAHDLTVGRQLARVLRGGDAPEGSALDEDALLALEREAFLALAATPQTVARIEHMLRHGRALRN